MNVLDDPTVTSFSVEARRRLTAVRGDPFLYVDWHPSVFLNFLVPSALLETVVHEPFELQTEDGMACVSLAAVTMRNFRARRRFSPAVGFGLIREQRFLNLRAYVTCRGEPGALFIHGWLSRPLSLPLPSAMFRLPYTFARLAYDHSGARIAGWVSGSGRAFSYEARREVGDACGPCVAGSNAEFSMERYSGFFSRSGQPYVFRVWHPPWQQVALAAEIGDVSLITTRFPWFGQAKLCGAHLTATLKDVWMGKAHRIRVGNLARRHSHALTSFYDMP